MNMRKAILVISGIVLPFVLITIVVFAEFFAPPLGSFGSMLNDVGGLVLAAVTMAIAAGCIAFGLSLVVRAFPDYSFPITLVYVPLMLILFFGYSMSLEGLVNRVDAAWRRGHTAAQTGVPRQQP
jgi:hypothetical protein